MSRLTTTTSLHESVARFVTAYFLDFGDAAARQDLTAMQAKVMLLLCLEPQPMPMRAIAGRLFCDASNITGVVDRLESRGLVRREVSPADRRVKNVVATEAGLELGRKIRAEQHRTHAALALMNAEEAATLARLLDRMIPTLEP
jgi:DNA-binding MarR family transcriptional regulator